jgi:hypothetical protein
MNLASRLSVSLRLAAIVGALCSACTDIASPAQIAVLVDADFNVRARVSYIEVELQSGPSTSDAGDTRVSSRVVPKPGLDGWPLHVALHAPQSTANRLSVTATAKDAADMTIAQARVVSDSHASAPLELVLRFDANCAARSEPCGATQTCRDGACIDAADTAVDLPLPDGGSSMPDGGATMLGGGSSMPGGGSSTPGGGASTPGAANSCGPDRGGCDPLAECVLDSSHKPICGVCPVGFAGLATTGCIAELIDLKLSGATLQPAFSPDQTDYQVELPLLSAAVIVQPSQAAGVTVQIEGATVASEAGWTAPPVAPGKSLKVNVTASAPAHMGRTYTLTLRRTLRAPEVLHAQNPAADDQFGVELAMSGDTFVTGAPSEDGGPNSHPGQYDDTLKDSGAAYVFVRRGNAWTQQAYLKANPPIQGANFGNAVAIEGERIAIGARKAGGGAVYIFERTAGTWQQTDRLAIDNAPSNLAFGATVALQGERLAIGAVGESDGASESGAVFMYEHSAAGWTRVARLKASKPGPLDWLGSSIAFDGDVLVSGATGQFVDGNPCGATHVFVRDGTAWNDQGILPATGLEAGALFGTSAAISGDTIAVGAFNGTAGLTSGAVFVFVRDGAGYRQEQVVRAPNPGGGDYFGLRLALATDRLLVGASQQSGQDPMNMGNSLAGAGAAYVFERNSGVWTPTLPLTAAPPGAQQQFGYSVALSGQTVAIAAIGDGSAGAGAVMVFE